MIRGPAGRRWRRGRIGMEARYRMWRAVFVCAKDGEKYVQYISLSEKPGDERVKQLEVLLQGTIKRHACEGGEMEILAAQEAFEKWNIPIDVKEA